MSQAIADDITPEAEDAADDRRQGEGFLKAIEEDPERDAPRLIYADWLEKQGFSARAEFIRVQCECEMLEQDYDTACWQYKSLKAREADLLDAHREEWEHGLQEAFKGSYIFREFGEEKTYHVEGIFRRGMLEGVTVYFEPNQNQEPSEPEEGEEVRFYVNNEMFTDFLKRLSACATKERKDVSDKDLPNSLLLREISFYKPGQTIMLLNDGRLEDMAASPALKNLKRLTLLRQGMITPAGINALAAGASPLHGLEELKIDGSFLDFGREAVRGKGAALYTDMLRSITCLKRFDKLRVLDLGNTPVYTDTLDALATTTPWLHGLEELHFDASHLEMNSFNRLASNAYPICNSLKKLHMRGLHNPENYDYLPAFHKLESLQLTDTSVVNYAGMQAVAKCGQLQEIHVDNPMCFIFKKADERKCRCFSPLFEAESRLRQLKSLHCSDTGKSAAERQQFWVADIEELASKTCPLDKLEHLTINGFTIQSYKQHKEVGSLMLSPLVDHLQTLNLSDNGLEKYALQVLSRRERPTSLTTLDYGLNGHKPDIEAWKSLICSHALDKLQDLTWADPSATRKKNAKECLSLLAERRHDILNGKEHQGGLPALRAVHLGDGRYGDFERTPSYDNHEFCQFSPDDAKGWDIDMPTGHQISQKLAGLKDTPEEIVEAEKVATHRPHDGPGLED